MTHNVYTRPDDLPVPVDDGACDHLPGQRLPDMALTATPVNAIAPATDTDQTVNFAATKGWLVIFIYPRTGQPGKLPLVEHWNEIAGARGCTPQTCGFRDAAAEFKALNSAVYGLSTQATAYHSELSDRLSLTFPMVSDEQFNFTRALSLPTFTVAGLELLKRCAIVAEDGVIRKVFYPVFPPEENAAEVLDYLKTVINKDDSHG